MTLSMSCRWWLNSLFNKSWDKSLMIGYNLERFANSPANLEYVTLLFWWFGGQKWDIANDFPWEIFTPLWIHARPSGRVMVSLSWNLCVQRKNKGSMTRRRARMPTLLDYSIWTHTPLLKIDCKYCMGECDFQTDGSVCCAMLFETDVPSVQHFGFILMQSVFTFHVEMFSRLIHLELELILPLWNTCMWICFADSISALVGFLRALQFPPTPKNQNPFIFLINSSGLSLCVQSLLGCLRFDYLCVRCGCHTAAPWEPSGLEVTRYKNCKLFVMEKVYFKSQILVHKYWTILDYFCVLVL